MRDPIAEIREERGRGRRRGITSVCSSHPLVLEAAVRRVARTGCPILIEATANQVNQHGGYTGLTPEEFAARLHSRCARLGAEPGLVVFGGDHLGPYPWRSRPAKEAMAEAETLVRRFVAAGARKIHLDASMPLGSDPGPALDPELAVERAVRLCRAAEDEFRALRRDRPDALAPVYVVGTEVPVPGGATGHDATDGPVPTRPEDFRAVVELHRARLAEAGLQDAWGRVIAVVVQPGVEFDASRVHQYRPERAAALVRALRDFPGLLFEGHSTDYQTDAALGSLVEDGVAVLKVGPALTFALREALFALCFVARELGADRDAGDLIDTLMRVMRASPEHWKGYYPEDASLPLMLAYGYSDRVRYYWDRPEVASAVLSLFAGLRGREIPPQILSQRLPRMGGVHEAARFPGDPESLAITAVEDELGRYERACDPDRRSPSPCTEEDSHACSNAVRG